MTTALTGKRVYDPTVREWLGKWLANEKSAVSDAPLTRYRQVVADFLSGIGPVANQRLEAVTSEHTAKTNSTQRNRTIGFIDRS
jgi:hypothetical protein